MYNPRKTKSDFLAAAIYMLASVTELFVNDLSRRLTMRQHEFKYEKKRAFTDLVRAAKGVDSNYEILQTDLWTDSKTARNFQDLQEEDNYIARIMLLYIDRFSHDERAKAELYDYMKSKEGVGIVDDAMLETFTLK